MRTPSILVDAVWLVCTNCGWSPYALRFTPLAHLLFQMATGELDELIVLRYNIIVKHKEKEAVLCHQLRILD
jgi:hypothetical protein